MKIQLKSDFIEPYDHWFDREGIVFERMSRNNISRIDMFRILEKAGFQTPVHGYVKQLYGVLHNNTYVVVYTDLYAHRSEGKFLCTLKRANDIGIFEENDDCYCSVLVPTEGKSSKSKRILRIDDWLVELMYESDDKWRSNYGSEVTITLIPARSSDSSRSGHRNFADGLACFYPMYAIDFVQSRKNKLWYAIDFNTSPGIKGTPLETDGKMIAALIKQWYTRHLYTLQDIHWPEAFTTEPVV